MILFPAPSINNKDNNDVCFHIKYVMKHCTISSSFVVNEWQRSNITLKNIPPESFARLNS